MTELFIVNMKRIGFDNWECLRATHSLATATEMAKGLRDAGHEANVQSVLINDNGQVSVD